METLRDPIEFILDEHDRQFEICANLENFVGALESELCAREAASLLAFLTEDQRYRGRTVVWLKEHFDDLVDVPSGLRISFIDEMLNVAVAIKRAVKPARLNYASLGNVAHHVHWHVIPRYENDPNWGGPPWPTEQPVFLSEVDYRALAADIRQEIPLDN